MKGTKAKGQVNGSLPFALCPFPLPLFLLTLSLAFAAACKHGATGDLERAASAWDAGDYAQAAEGYEHYLYQYPTGEASLAARLKLANIYYLNLRRYEQAREQYQEFLRQDGVHAEAALARERLAEVLAELGRTYEAIAEYENLNPADLNERRRVRLKIADVYDDEVDNSVAAMTAALEPIMIVFLAVVVGTIVIALFLPLISIIQGLQQQT